MRRREKFIISSLALSFALIGVLLIPTAWRVWSLLLFGGVTYGLAAWALSEDLQKNEYLTILPLPTLYALAIASFYFVLPASMPKRVLFIVLFGIGMYALLLTGNIFSVAKGRTIQLLYAAQTIALFFSLLISFLITNTLFTFNLPFAVTAGLVAAFHFPLIAMSIWSVQLRSKLDRTDWALTGLLTLAVFELSIALSFIPYAVWAIGLLIMSLLYIGLGVFQSYLKGRLFIKTIREYSLVTGVSILLFLLLFPGK